MPKGAGARLHSLDGMRGIAACAVVLHHVGYIVPLPMFREAYLAVDLFFALSGYVLARAYEARLAAGLSVFRFTEYRMVRLYPLFFVGILAGLVKSVGQLVFQDDQALTVSALSLAFITNIFMLPVPFGSPYLFPLNAPAWSLFCELLVNVVYGFFFYKQRTVFILFLAIGAIFFVGPEITAGDKWASLSGASAHFIFFLCRNCHISSLPM